MPRQRRITSSSSRGSKATLNGRGDGCAISPLIVDCPPLPCPAGSLRATARTAGTDWRRAAETLGCRSEEHTSELQSLMRISYAVFCLKKKKDRKITQNEYVEHITPYRNTIVS